MKTLILTDQEFNKLYEVFEPTYIALKGRVELKSDLCPKIKLISSTIISLIKK